MRLSGGNAALTHFADTFTGILPAHAPAYVAAEVAGALVAALILPKLFSR
jgi:hypothetical protein